jgi:hypothetical protein
LPIEDRRFGILRGRPSRDVFFILSYFCKNKHYIMLGFVSIPKE